MLVHLAVSSDYAIMKLHIKMYLSGPKKQNKTLLSA